MIKFSRFRSLACCSLSSLGLAVAATAVVVAVQAAVPKFRVSYGLEAFILSEDLCKDIEPSVREVTHTSRTDRRRGRLSSPHIAAMFRNAVRRVAAPVALRAAAAPARAMVPRAASGTRKTNAAKQGRGGRVRPRQ